MIYLLNSGCDFVKNNSKVRFAKVARERIDKPDYAERAITEAVVNALIHRDYMSMGSEIHIDMFDDRLEIASPGGMYKGKAVQEQDITKIKSERRNPILADLFHRMRYMERRGSGLTKIINETKNLQGYTDAFKPEFYSDTFFNVIIKNVNYTGVSDNVTDNVTDVTENVTDRSAEILKLIKENKNISTEEIAKRCKMTKRTILRDLALLKEKNMIKRIGTSKTGHWEVIK